MKLPVRYHCITVFAVLTVLYIITKGFVFKGFNGTDDLHYGMLAAKMLKGEYDPFEPGDIFSGRILLIASQAGIYKLAGINIISTQLGSLMVVILSCYLTVTRLLSVKNVINTSVAVSLFYFNPVVTEISFEIRGDVYVLLAGLLICILLKSWIQNNKTDKKSILTGSLMAFLVVLCLLFKETMLVFLPFVCIVAFLCNRKHAMPLIVSLIVVFACVIILYGLLYDHFTGDAFFKIKQIQNSSYPNHCSFDLQPVKDQIIRLTYGVYQEFVTRGFYPVVLGVIALVYEWCAKRRFLPEQNLPAVFFGVLLITGHYFPFSLHGYQPLCSDARQFLFLLPLGVVVATGYVCNAMESRYARGILISGSLMILLVCMLSTGNKWQWMIYLLISIWIVTLIVIERLPRALVYTMFTGVLWISIIEHRFFKNSNWFSDMIALNTRIDSKCYYFPDHDNMMHWQLLHHFNQETFSFYNLYPRPFKVYSIYYQRPLNGNFHPGWFIVNKAYNVRSPALLEKIDSLNRSGYFKKEVSIGDVSAFYIDKQETLSYVQSLIESND